MSIQGLVTKEAKLEREITYVLIPDTELCGKVLH